MTSIYLFNASPQSISLTIRTGTPALKITGTGTSTLWFPMTPTKQPAWGGTSPTPGQIGYGANDCILNDGNIATPFTILVPTSVGPTDSIEIYLYYWPPPEKSGQPGLVSWVLLQNGRPIGGSLNLST
ncbi:MAG TPA: hypothetical protein VGJ51_18510 [Candidatus Angelobacter sp.]|jgi:hypothetical protein